MKTNGEMGNDPRDILFTPMAVFIQWAVYMVVILLIAGLLAYMFEPESGDDLIDECKIEYQSECVLIALPVAE